MTAITILVALAGLGLLSCLLMIAVRFGWKRIGEPVGGGWWVLALSAAVLWSFTVSTGLRANALASTAAALAELKIVTGAEIMAEPDAWLNVPVVIHDQAFCAEPMGDPNAEATLAVRIKSSGEDEVEGEESDYMGSVQYGVEQDVVKFTLMSPDSKLRSNEEGFTVLPAGSPVRKQIDTGEFSPVKGGNLMDIEERRSIACGDEIFVSGIITKEGAFVVLEPLPKALSILTNRPWTQIVSTATSHASRARVKFFVWFGLATLLLMLQGALMWARRPQQA